MKLRDLLHIRRRPASAIAVGLTVFIVFVTILAGYAGTINPLTMPSMATLAMSFPAWLLLSLVSFIVLLLRRSRLAWIVAAGLVAVMPPALTYSPVGSSRELTPQEKPRSFTVLTFNVYYWSDYLTNVDDYSQPNRSMQYILDTNPDIVCLQEAIMPKRTGFRTITKEQADTFRKRYPYIFQDNAGVIIVASKYPLTRMESEDSLYNSFGNIAKLRVSIEGHLLTLYTVYLQSFRLTDEEKAMFKKAVSRQTDVNQVLGVRSQLFGKLDSAFCYRAMQAQYLRTQLDNAHSNTIVCGDFNDIPGSYATRTIQGNDMTDAYRKTGFGPGLTFRANHFFFRIDHLFYRGDFEAINCRRGFDVISDHYPLLTTFVWNEPQNS